MSEELKEAVIVVLFLVGAVLAFLWYEAEHKLREQRRLNDILLGRGDDDDYWDAIHAQEDDQ